MTITARQLERRAGYVGASDVATIVGANPYANITDLWHEKMGMLTPDLHIGMAAEIGNWCEAGLLDYLETLVGKIRRGGERRWKACSCVLVHLDGQVVSDKAPTDGKTTGMLGPVVGDWGEDGTDEVPDNVTAQVQTQIAATDADQGHIIALVGSKGLRHYVLARNDALIAELQYWVNEFWEKNVKGNVQPTETPCMGTLSRVVRQPKAIVKMPPEAAAELLWWNAAKAAAKLNGATADEHKAKLLNMIGDAEAGEFPDGQVLTYLEQKRAGFTVEPGKSRVARMTTMKKLTTKWEQTT